MPNVVIYVATPWANLPTKTSPLDASALNHIEQGIVNATNFLNTLNAASGLVLCEVAFTNTLKNKLDGIEAQANKYILPTATANVLGGVKIDGSTIVIDGNGVISATTSGIDELSNLTDVNIDQIADGQILKWDATAEKWVNTSEAEVRTQLSLLEDVDIDDTTLEDGQVLKYNGTSEKWENGEGGDVLGYDETLDVLGLPPNPIYRWRGSVPAMTGATTPSGEASAGSQQSNFEAWKAFNGNDDVTNINNRWVTAANVYGSWIQYMFDEPKLIEKFSIIAGGATTDPCNDCDITIKGSNDGITFTDIHTFRWLAEYDRIKVEDSFENSDSYIYYRLQFSDWTSKGASSGNKFNSAYEVQFYERYLA